MICEFETFVARLFLKEPNILSTLKVATFAHQWQKLFPLTKKLYQLHLAVPVTVARDERIFSRLRLIKTYLR